MKRIVLLTTTAVLLLIGKLSAQNVFDQNDVVNTYNSAAPSGSVTNPVLPPNGTMAKWIRTTAAYNGTQVTWDSRPYKPYIWNGMAFRLIYPKSYQQNVVDGKTYPIVCFWHGGGEIGPITNNEIQLFNGGNYFATQIANSGYDGFMLFPQETQIGWETSYFSRVNSVLDTLVKYCKVDPDRVISMGLSSGGYGTISYADENPMRVAKMIASSPASVGSITPHIPSYLQIPLWMASGGLDVNPTPLAAYQFDTSFAGQGGNILYDFFPNDAHNTWDDQWAKPYFLTQLSTAHKANPLVYYQKNLLCPDSVINVRMGLTAGFYAYQWEYNGTIIQDSTRSELYAKQYGTYRARFQRTSTSAWSAWSPTPVIISMKPRYNAPAIAIQGVHTNVLPGADSSYTVPLMEPASYGVNLNYQSYRWVRASDNSIVSSSQVFTTGIGQFKAAVMDTSACYSSFTPVYTVVNANGFPKPDRPKNLNATPQGGAAILLDWTNSATVVNAPTGYEIYRGTKSGGPYTYAATVPGNTFSYTDNGLLANTYYYIVRSVSGVAAGTVSNEASATAVRDSIAPTAPTNLTVGWTTRQTVDLSWGASTDNVGVYKYDVYINGVKSYTTDSLSTTIYNLTGLTTYTFTVKARDKAGNSSQPSNQAIGSTVLNGLKWRFYQGYYYSLPNFDTAKIILTGVSPNVNIGVRPAGVDDQFGFVWEGYIKIPGSGIYTFGLNSDDGSAMYVNSFYNFNTPATVNNDGAHGAGSVITGTYNFPAAGVYPIAVSYFEQGGAESIALTWQGSGTGGNVTIPNSAFTDNVSLGSTPTAPSALNATAVSYKRINLGWTDNSSTETGFEIVRSTAAAGPFNPLATTAAGINSFVDTFALSPSTAYYYKVRAVNANGASAFTSVANNSTQALPGAPSAPSGLNMVVNSNKQISLNWVDNAGNETGMEVWRSSNDASNYRVIATLNPNTINYVDATVSPNETYLYKVRAIIAGNASGYSNQVTGRTFDTKPSIITISDFTMRYGTQFVLPVKATDPDNDDISFTYLKLPAFATAATTSNGNATITFSPNVIAQGAYTIGVVANDNNGRTDTARFNLVVNTNYPPAATPVSNVTIDEGSTTNINLSATDQEGSNNITWTFTNLPSFATYTRTGNGTGTIAVAPGYAAAGVYNISATANDGVGGKTPVSFTITVNDKSPNTKWYVKINYNHPASAPWNNIGGVANNLLNATGQTTPVGVAISAPNNISLYSYGTSTGNNSGVYPDAVLQDCFYLSSATDIGNIRISNLNPALTYNFRLLSATVNGSENASSRTVFKIGSKADSVLDKNNTTMTAYLGGITPDGQGNVNIQWYKGAAAGTQNAYINAFEIEQIYNDGTAPVKAQGIASTFIPGTGAKVTWKDIAYNETSYNVYRSSNSAGPYTQLNPGATNPNDTSYIDATATASATYYYYVVASNSVGNSPSSDTTTLVTGNNPPIIGAITNLYVKAGSSASVNFTASDDPSDLSTLSATSPDLPTSFVALTGGPTNYTITANPGIDNVGFYTVTINVVDNKGLVSKKTFNILVSDNTVKTALVKFGGDGFTLPKPWNNLSSGFPLVGTQTAAMTDDGGAAVSWGVQLVTQFDGYWAAGPGFAGGFKTGNDAGVVPDTVMCSGIYSNQTSGTPRTLKLTGLDPTKRYSVGFVSAVNQGNDFTAVVSSGSKSATFNGAYNANTLARLNGLTPAADGSVSINIQKTASSNSANISAMIIQEYAAGVNLSPTNLIVEPIDTNKIKLTFSDRADGETGVEVYRATSFGGAYTLITTLAANNTGTYTDATVSPNTRYYYKVRSKMSTSVFSAYSNIASTITFNNVIYVNMKDAGPGGYPWNNTGKVPATGDAFALKDAKGNVTGSTMTIVNNFTGGSGNIGSSTGNNSGVFPDSVLLSNYIVGAGTTATVKFSNLDQSKRYRVGFAGSNNNWAPSYNTTYSIGNRTVYLSGLYNTTKAVYIDGVIPNVNGEITANISTTSDASSGMLNAIVLQAYTYVAGGTATDIPVASQAIRINTGTAADSAARRDSVVRTPAELKAYPNPFSDYVNLMVQSANTIDKLAIEIYDSNGKIMFAKVFSSVPSGTNTIRISTAEANLQQGIYFMRVHSNDGSTNSMIKLIKIIK
ncbi:fibronectin type III domain-containing protein [Pinibacter soli]|uniref:PA14 domain-containing protein n=1 Tax=Pinibacter soli TaxID=3044211 RepID=A0ABT6R6L6_9BACT|nr:PA14 domain-containing protein [Pinibacter soli]MDI3318202.1 PA14 domain-containing protein [Pinibacter soli]